MEAQQRRNYKKQEGTLVAVRCARCDRRRPGTTATAFAVLCFSVPPWLDESWRAPGGYCTQLDDRDARWWLAPVRHGSSLALLRSGRGELVGAGVAAALGLERAFPRDPLLSKTEALRSRVAAVGEEDWPWRDLSPSAGVDLGPCRGSGCKNRPRVTLRVLYAAADRAVMSGGEAIFF